MASDHLIQEVGRVHVLDLAGRIISDPKRTNISTAGGLALALALESAWAVAIEAELLARALTLSRTRQDADSAALDHAIKMQRDKVLQLMAAIRGEPETKQEKNDGSSHS